MTLYRITLAPMPGDVPPLTRLKRALRCLSRSFRLRAVRVEELPAPASAAEGRRAG